MSVYLNVYALLPRSTDTTVSRHLILIAPKRQPDTGTMVFASGVIEREIFEFHGDASMNGDPLAVVAFRILGKITKRDRSRR
jgi:hypothetical protein